MTKGPEAGTGNGGELGGAGTGAGADAAVPVIDHEGEGCPSTSDAGDAGVSPDAADADCVIDDDAGTTH